MILHSSFKLYFLMTIDVENLFICLLVIWMLFSVRCLLSLIYPFFHWVGLMIFKVQYSTQFNKYYRASTWCFIINFLYSWRCCYFCYYCIFFHGLCSSLLNLSLLPWSAILSGSYDFYCHFPNNKLSSLPMDSNVRLQSPGQWPLYQIPSVSLFWGSLVASMILLLITYLLDFPRIPGVIVLSLFPLLTKQWGKLLARVQWKS